MRGILYIRVSDKQQVANTSLDTQEEQGIKWFASNNVELVEVFKEEGQSAQYIERTQLQRAIEFATNPNNDIQIFAVAKLDRFSREIGNHYLIKNILAQANVKLISVTESIPDDESGVFFEAMLAAYAQYENIRRKNRTTSGTNATIEKRNKWPYPAPFGYIKDKNYMGSDAPPIIPDPERFESVRYAWQLLLSGNYTRAEILRQVTKMGLRTRTGKKVSKQLLAKIFQNHFYYGKLKTKGEIITAESMGNHIPMITESEFHKVQAMFSESQFNRKHKPINKDFPLNRIVFCSNCERLMSGAWSTGRHGGKYGYYACRYKDCNKKDKFKKDVLEKKYLDMLEDISLSSDFKEGIIDSINILHRPNLEKLEEQQKNIRKERNKIEAKIDRIKEAYEEGVYSKEEYEDRTQKAKIDLVGIETNINIINTEISQKIDIITFTIDYLEPLSKTWIVLSPLQKHEFNKFILPKGCIFKNENLEPLALHDLFYKLEILGGGKVNDGGDWLSNLETIIDELYVSMQGFLSIINPNYAY